MYMIKFGSLYLTDTESFAGKSRAALFTSDEVFDWFLTYRDLFFGYEMKIVAC